MWAFLLVALVDAHLRAPAEAAKPEPAVHMAKAVQGAAGTGAKSGKGRHAPAYSLAFVTGVFGAYATNPASLGRAFAFLETLGRMGGYTGTVYLLTDHPDELGRIVEATDRTDPEGWYLDDTIVGPASVKIVPIPKGKVKTPGMLKTLLLDLPAIKEDVLIWHDADTVIARRDCVKELLETPLEFSGSTELLAEVREGRPAEGRQGTEATLLAETMRNWPPSTFALHRTRSRSLMRAWASEEWKRAEHQVAQSGHGFVSTLAAIGAEKHVGLLPQGYSSKPFNPNEFWCFNHVSEMQCLNWADRPKKMTYWLRHVKLINPLANKVKWCDITNTTRLHELRDLYGDKEPIILRATAKLTNTTGSRK